MLLDVVLSVSCFVAGVAATLGAGIVYTRKMVRGMRLK